MFRNVVIDCQDLARQAAFWSALSGFERRWSDESYVLLVDPDHPRPRILLQHVPERKQTKNRLHLDFEVPDMAAEVERLIGLGATRVEERDHHGPFTVLQDPEGNELCIVQERPR
jgi:catechol 2,3-dioxygenase-like lactoylglutathione lyase family enzyme